MCAEHIEDCLECSHLFDRVSQAGKASRTKYMDFFPETYIIGGHLDYEQISGYLDNKLDKDSAEFIELHAGLCSRCGKDLRSLKEFRESLDAELDRRQTSWGLIGKPISGFRKPKLPNPVYVFGAVAVIALFGLLGFAIYRWGGNRGNEPRQDRAETTPSPQSTIEKQAKGDPIPAIVDRQKGKNRQSKNSEIIVDNGKKFAIDYQGNRISSSDLAPELQAIAEDVLRGEPVGERALLEQLKQDASSLRGGGGVKKRIFLVSPVGVLVEDDRPVFKWKPMDGATGYVVEIVDVEFRPVAQSHRLDSTEWTIENNLKRGQIYMWQVKAIRDEEKIANRSNGIGKFMVISDKKFNELRAARKKYDSHLEMGIYYLKEGLLEEAKREFESLRSKNPSSKLVNNLYRRVQMTTDNRRGAEDAEEAQRRRKGNRRI